MPRPRHPDPEIESAVRYAESKGWRWLVSAGHNWGSIWCPHQARDGCRLPVFSTPRSPTFHARKLRRDIDRCPHAQGVPEA